MKSRKGCLPRTIHHDRVVLTSVLQFLTARGRPSDPARWTVQDAAAVKEFKHNAPDSMRLIASFARFCGSGVMAEVGRPSKPKATPIRWLTREQMRAVQEVARTDPVLSFLALLGLGQGLRRGEWCRLQVSDVDLVGGRMLLRWNASRGRRTAWVPLHPAFPRVYRDVLEHRRRVVAQAQLDLPGCEPPPEVLVKRDGRGELRPYTVSDLARRVRDIEGRLRRRGIEVRLSSQMFRRSGATLLEETLREHPGTAIDGVYRQVQGFLRHRDLGTTVRYLEANPERHRKALEVFARALPWDRTKRAPQPPN